MDNNKHDNILSSNRLLIFLIISVIAGDLMVAAVLHIFPELSLLQELLIDSILLSVIIFPVLYFLAFRPLTINIRERRITEEFLRSSEERYRTVTQSANDAIISTDFKGNIVGWNRGAENIFWYKEQEILGKSLNLIIPDEYLEQHKTGMKRVETSGEKRVIGRTVELQGLRKGGVLFSLELSLSEWETSEGKFFTGIIRDITKRRRTELENQINYEITQGITSTYNLNELLELIHHSLGKIVYTENFFIALHDPQSKLFTFPYFVDKCDHKPLSSMLKKSCTTYVFKSGKPLLLTRNVFDGLIEQGEVELVGTNSPSWIGIPLNTPSKTIGVMVLQHYEKEYVYSETDVEFLHSIGGRIAVALERKRSEEEIRQKNEQLSLINAEKDKIFSIIAHDLRSPLSGFIGTTNILSEELDSLTKEEIQELVQILKNSSESFYRLIENLLDWSLIQRRLISYIPENAYLLPVVNNCINLLAESSGRKNISVKCYVPDDTRINADIHMLETVIRNLISNAVKFTPGGGEITILASSADNSTIQVEIRDTGIGMNSELIDKLFILNEKTSRNGTEGEPSTGLGLMLCKEFVEKNGGKISVESEEGKGSSFIFSVPGAIDK